MDRTVYRIMSNMAA